MVQVSRWRSGWGSVPRGGRLIACRRDMGHSAADRDGLTRAISARSGRGRFPWRPCPWHAVPRILPGPLDLRPLPPSEKASRCPPWPNKRNTICSWPAAKRVQEANVARGRRTRVEPADVRTAATRPRPGQHGWQGRGTDGNANRTCRIPRRTRPRIVPSARRTADHPCSGFAIRAILVFENASTARAQRNTELPSRYPPPMRFELVATRIAAPSRLDIAGRNRPVEMQNPTASPFSRAAVLSRRARRAT